MPPPWVAYMPVKPPGQAYARAGFVLSIIGLVFTAFIGLVFIGSVQYSYYSIESFLGDLILFVIIAVMPFLGILFGVLAKRREYPKKTATVSVILGCIGMGLILIMIIAALIKII